MGGHHNCCNKQKVKRGLWSPEEDEKLVNYISAYGHGCWSSVPKLAGLQRCGKSCRLRWINYLRPDLKRGSFSSYEANLIIKLHKVLGNRWAQIARHLPGRTDNEVKNFWNSSIKKRLLNHGYDGNASTSHGVSPTITFQNPNTSSYQGLYPLNPNTNLNLMIPCPAAPPDPMYLHPNSAPPLQGLISNFNTVNILPSAPLTGPVDPTPYDPTWSTTYPPCHPQEAMFIANNGAPLYGTMPFLESYGDESLMAPMMPKLCQFIDVNGAAAAPEPNTATFANSLPSFTPTAAYCGLHAPADQMEYLESFLSLFPPSSSSESPSVSSSEQLSLFSPLSCTQFGLNPNLHASWFT